MKNKLQRKNFRVGLKYYLPKSLNWNLKVGKLPPTDYGSFSFDKREVVIDPRDRSREEILATCIHEALHLSYDFLTEEAVEQGEQNIMKLLQRYGVIDWLNEE